MHGILLAKNLNKKGVLNGFRVYIAKITFTTLIDHFTSLCRHGIGL